VRSTGTEDAGTYTASVSVTLANYSSVAPVKFQITVDVTECVVTSLTPVTPVTGLNGSTFMYNLFSAAMDIPFAYKQTPACNYSMTIVSSLTSAAIAFDEINSKFTLESSSLSDAGVGVSVTIDVTLDDTPGTTLQETFTVDLVDPCPTATLVGSSAVPDIVTFIGAPTVSLVLPVVTDSVAVLNSMPPICATTATVTATDPAYMDVGYLMTGQDLDVSSEPPHESASFELEFTTTLDANTNEQVTSTFQVSYLLHETSPIDPVTYLIGLSGDFTMDFQQSRILPEAQALSLDLGLTKSLHFVDLEGDLLDDLPSWIKFNNLSGETVISTTDGDAAGVYIFAVVSTVTQGGAPYKPANVERIDFTVTMVAQPQPDEPSSVSDFLLGTASQLPYLAEEISDQIVECGEAAKIMIPKIINPDEILVE